MTGSARHWWQDEPRRLARERAAMRAAAPAFGWSAVDSWQGAVPLWPFRRPEPTGLLSLVDGRPLDVRLSCGPAYPMIQPKVRPVSELPDWDTWGSSEWHLAPDGSLCLFQQTTAWDPAELAATLVPRISSWYIQFQLMRKGVIGVMLEYTMEVDDSLDALVERSR